MSKHLLETGFFAFEDLEVYQLSVDYRVDMYTLLTQFPDSEKFGLVSQIKRSVTSVTLNIAEGRGRGTDKDFVKFLHQARGSLFEVVAGFHLAERLGFVKREQTKILYSKAKTLVAKLSVFIQKLSEKDS
jgi:four helix bundle protein